METLSPMAVDVEMESPKGQSEDLLTRQEAGMIDAPALAYSLYVGVSQSSNTTIYCGGVFLLELIIKKQS